MTSVTSVSSNPNFHRYALSAPFHSSAPSFITIVLGSASDSHPKHLVRQDLRVPADIDSLKLKDEDKQELLTAVEEHNKLRDLFLDMLHEHEEIVYEALLSQNTLTTVDRQLREAAGCFVAVLDLARRPNGLTNRMQAFEDLPR